MRTSLVITHALSVVAGAVVAGALVGCGAPGDDPASGGEDERVRVVATTMPLRDFARQVGGERASIHGILEPGAEPHDYEPTPSDADAIAAGDVVVSNGGGLDDWLGDLLEQAGGDATRVIATGGLPMRPSEDGGSPRDPHVWHDPELAKRMVDNVAAGLVRADPAGAETYRANAARYKQRLDAMAAAIRRELADVPPGRRKLVTSHDAFGYFARAYDIKLVGSVLPTVGAESEPSARHVRRLIDEIRRHRVGVIFAEKGTDPRLERRVAEEAGARVSTSLYADSLGPPGSGAESLVAAEYANARALRSAWKAPERPPRH